MVWFFVGLFVGSTAGCIAMALCVAAKMGDNHEDQ